MVYKSSIQKSFAYREKKERKQESKKSKKKMPLACLHYYSGNCGEVAIHRLVFLSFIVGPRFDSSSRSCSSERVHFVFRYGEDC